MNNYFYGWYLKYQSGTQSVAIIPAVHESNGNKTYSIQIITEEMSWNENFMQGQMQAVRKSGNVYRTWQIGKNRFGPKGMYLDIDTQEVHVKGCLRFCNHTPIKYDIMGPFAFVPYMECRHSVYSMQHRVTGKLYINGKPYVFRDAWGYWEGDRGHSFPKKYAWTQAFLFGEKNWANKKWKLDLQTDSLNPDGSIMLSVADIPVAGIHFTGVIGVVNWKGKEYRFATYLGARVMQNSENRLLVRQGNMELEAKLLEENAHDLQAPVNGAMHRVIRENLTCKAFYCLRKRGKTIFAVETERASFEFEY